MNPGYLSLLFISVWLILLASGWKDILLPGASRLGILAFFAGWLLSAMISVRLVGLELQATVPYLLLCAAAATLTIPYPLARANLWLCGLLLGTFDCLMRELNGWTLLAPGDRPGLSAALAMSILTILLGRGALWQGVAISVGLVASEALYVWLHREAVHNLGGAAFADHWWLLFCMTRGLSVILETAGRLLAGGLKHRTK